MASPEDLILQQILVPDGLSLDTPIGGCLRQGPIDELKFAAGRVDELEDPSLGIAVRHLGNPLESDNLMIFDSSRSTSRVDSYLSAAHIVWPFLGAEADFGSSRELILRSRPALMVRTTLRITEDELIKVLVEGKSISEDQLPSSTPVGELLQRPLRPLVLPIAFVALNGLNLAQEINERVDAATLAQEEIAAAQ